MKIMYWSDYACPYCYIAEARLHKAVAELGLEDAVIYEPRAFELDPGAPAEAVSATPERFAQKYRLPLPEARAQVEHISSLGRAEGLDFRYATTRYTNTFNAHRLMKFALATAPAPVARQVNDLLFAAYFTLNLPLAQDSTLLDVARQAGLNEAEAQAMLAGSQYAAEVRADEREAARRGIRGVPYFVFDNGITVPGAISLADFRNVLASSRDVHSARQCGPDGCLLN